MAGYETLLANPEPVLSTLEQLLKQQPQGISEYELLGQLAEHYPFFSKGTADSQLGLFQRHFLLFHWLYQLRSRHLSEQTGVLEISALRVQLAPYCNCDNSTDLQLHDSLADYYNNINNLHEANDHQIDELLARFWIALSRRESRQAALELLELSDPVDDQAIRQQYRRLVMQHHPDRDGGTTDRIQQLNQAIAQLLPKPM